MNICRGSNKHLFIVGNGDMLIGFSCVSLIEYIFRWLTHTRNQTVFQGILFFVSLVILVCYRVCKQEKWKFKQNSLVIVVYGFLFLFQFGESTIVHCTTHDIWPNLESPISVLYQHVVECSYDKSPSFCYCQFVSISCWTLAGVFVSVGTDLQTLLSTVCVIVPVFILGGSLLHPLHFWRLHLPYFFFLLVVMGSTYQAFYYIAIEICRIRNNPYRALDSLPLFFFFHIESRGLIELPRGITKKNFSYEEHLFFLLRVTQSVHTRQIAMNLITEYPGARGMNNSQKQRHPDRFLRSALLWFHLERHRKRSIPKGFARFSICCPSLPASSLAINFNRLHPWVTLFPPQSSQYSTTRIPGWRQDVLEYSFTSLESNQSTSFITDSSSELLNVFKIRRKKWSFIPQYLAQRFISFYHFLLAYIFNFNRTTCVAHASDPFSFQHNPLEQQTSCVSRHFSPFQAISNSFQCTPRNTFNNCANNQVLLNRETSLQHTMSNTIRLKHESCSLNSPEKNSDSDYPGPHQWGLNLPSPRPKRVGYSSLLATDVLSSIRILETVKEHVCLYNDMLRKTFYTVATPIVIDFDETAVKHYKFTPLKQVFGCLMQIRFWIGCVETLMRKAEWRYHVRIPRQNCFGHFIDIKVERWFLAWLSAIQARHYISLCPVTWIVTLCCTTLACLRFLIKSHTNDISVQFSFLATSQIALYAFLFLRVLLQMLPSAILLSLQQEKYYKSSCNAHHFKRRAFYITSLNLFFCTADIYLEAFLFPKAPISLYSLLLVGMAFPALSQLSVTMNVIVSSILTLLTLCCLPLLDSSLYSFFNMTSSLLSVCISLALYSFLISECILTNYRFLFSRYVLPYLFYIDALQPLMEEKKQQRVNHFPYNTPRERSNSHDIHMFSYAV